MTIGLWQIPVMVGAGIAVLTYLVSWVVGKRRPPESRAADGHAAAWRTAILAVLSIILFGLLVSAVRAVGTSVTVNIAAVASLVLEGAALRLTYLSYIKTKEINQATVRKPAPPPAGAEPG